MDFLGGDERKSGIEVKPHLVTKHATGTGAGAVGLVHAVVVHVAHEVFVLGADQRGHCKAGTEVAGEPIV